ncbi:MULTISPECIES: MFS transporter [Gordonibacter]|uniref:MFS transporter n=1 Tax=Gordonibacter faecis TaxID=3047475 RepID=A0ABT7DP38_9ACTN|nr:MULTISPECIES: MFS transporter [unclassified Gordonibacter]MDJ1650296.1 MFS transporter [Gordonibacter sp. KGMB12511]
MKGNEQALSPKRWIAVICIGLMHASLMGALMIPGAYASVFIGEWGVPQELFVQLTMISFLTGAIFSIPMGMLADRYGVTKVLGIGMVISLVASIARIFCTDFWPLYASCFAMGIGLAGMNANSVKFLRAWFSEKQVTTAMTLYVSGAGIGVTVAMGVASQVPDLGPAFTGASVVFAVACIIWFAFARMPKGVEVMKDEYSMTAVKSVLSNKTLLLVSLAMVFSMTASASYAGNVPIALQGKGLDPVTAAAWASLINLCGMPSNWIIGPVADFIKRIKPVMAVSSFLGSALLIAAWVAPVGDYSLPLFLIGAFVTWGNVALIKGSVGMIPTIKPEYMGTAGGIQTFFQNLAAFIIPSFILTPLCGGDMALFFVYCGVAVILAGVTMMLAPELGLKGKIHQEEEAELEAVSRSA